MTYAEEIDGESRMIKMAPPKGSNAKGEEEHERMVAVRNWVTQTDWKESEGRQGRGGVTWLELYICFQMHSEKAKRRRGMDLLEPKHCIQIHLAHLGQLYH